VQRIGSPAYLSKLTKALEGMLGLGFTDRTAKVHCGGFVLGALQCKTVSPNIPAEPSHPRTVASLLAPNRL